LPVVHQNVDTVFLIQIGRKRDYEAGFRIHIVRKVVDEAARRVNQICNLITRPTANRFREIDAMISTKVVKVRENGIECFAFQRMFIRNDSSDQIKLTFARPASLNEQLEAELSVEDAASDLTDPLRVRARNTLPIDFHCKRCIRVSA